MGLCETIDSQPSAAPQIQEPLYHYVVVRDGLSPGLMAAQVCHAAGESSPGDLPSGTYAVVLTGDKPQLENLERQLQREGVPHAAIRESDPPFHGELLAIGLKPTLKKEVKRYVSSLPLLR